MRQKGFFFHLDGLLLSIRSNVLHGCEENMGRLRRPDSLSDFCNDTKKLGLVFVHWDFFINMDQWICTSCVSASTVYF